MNIEHQVSLSLVKKVGEVSRQEVEGENGIRELIYPAYGKLIYPVGTFERNPRKSAPGGLAPGEPTEVVLAAVVFILCRALAHDVIKTKEHRDSSSSKSSSSWVAMLR